MIDFRTACNPHCKANHFLNYFCCQKGFFQDRIELNWIKLYLWDCRKKQVLPNIEGFKFKVRIKYQVEKYISTKNNKLETFYEKWPKDISPL